MKSCLFLLIMLIGFLFMSIASASDSPRYIYVDHDLSPNIINVTNPLETDSSTVTLTINGMDSIPRNNLDVVLVVDISNSMAPYLSDVKDATKIFIDQLNRSHDKIGFVCFNSTLGPYSELSSNYKAVNRSIYDLTINTNNNTKGSTCLSIGLKKAIEILSAQNDSSVKAIVILSDGNNETCSPVVNDNPCMDATIAKENGIIIFPIGINDAGKGTRYLKCMSASTGGRYYANRIDKIDDIFKHLSNLLPNIIANNLVLRYEIPYGIRIDNESLKQIHSFELDHNILSIDIGTISSNEKYPITFNLIADKPGNYSLGIFGKSGLSFSLLNGTTTNMSIARQNLRVLDEPYFGERNKTKVPPREISDEGPKNTNPFSLTGLGKAIPVADPITNIQLIKIVDKNETSNQPKITISIKTPPVKSMDLVFAIDSSGSTNSLNPSFEDTIQKVVPLILEKLISKDISARISVVSWDNDIDFAYPSGPAYDYKTTKLVKLDKSSLEQINRIINSKLFVCDENDLTFFNSGIEASTYILTNPINKPVDPVKDLRVILLMVTPGEYLDCNKTFLDIAADPANKIKIAAFGLGVSGKSKMSKSLKAIAERTNGESFPMDGEVVTSEAEMSLYIDKMIDSIIDGPIIFNATIVDTLYPYLQPDLKSITGAKLINKSGTNTLFLDVGDLNPNTTTNVSFDVSLEMALPVDFTREPEIDLANYKPRANSPISQFAYEWYRPGNYTPIELPENSIDIKSFASSQKPVDSMDMEELKNKSGVDFGLLALISIAVMFALRRKNNE